MQSKVMTRNPSLFRTFLRFRSASEGFTLVELLVAITVLSLGMLAVASLLMTAITLNSLGQSTNDAMAQARDKIENLKTLADSDAQRAVGGSTTSDVTGYNDTVGIYHRRWSIANGPASSKIYTVSVTPTVGDNRTKESVTMTTIF